MGSNAFLCLIPIAICVLLSSLLSRGEQPRLQHPDDAGSRYVNEWAVHMHGSLSDVKAVARQLGFIYHRPVHGLDGFHVFRRPERVTSFSAIHHHRLRRHASVRWVEQQRAKVRKKRNIRFNDKLYDKQWYLNKGATGGFDMNVQKAWAMGYTGKGVVITILDDGIEYTHPDLKRNYDPQASSDINDNDNDPMPRATFDNENKHGTRCAGEVAAVANNGLCSVGVAYNAKIGGVRMLDGDITDSVEGSSLSLRQDHIDIYSGSWGPDDNGKVVDGPGLMAKKAFENGVLKGRGGLGNIFVWASGNGGSAHDSCACDGYAGSIYTLSVSSVSEHNKKPWYLEECASTLASTYSSGYTGERQIVTTDLHQQCTMQHTGTSASAPLAAGIIALMLEANRNLTWRDVQYLTVLTANPAPFVDAAWITNGVKRKVSLLYGFGLMDAGKMVFLAPLLRRTPIQRKCPVGPIKFNKPLYGKQKAIVKFSTDGCKKGSRTVSFLEHVLLYLNLSYTKRGDLRITLVSPAGTRSILLPPRSLDTVSGPTKFNRWPLMSVQFWGENPSGTWSLEVENVGANFNSGQLASGQLVLFGVSVPPVRLRSPESLHRAPPAWFKQHFQSYVMSDAEYQASDVQDKKGEAGQSRKPGNDKSVHDKKKRKCHDECANSSACSGPAPTQCHDCRHFKDATSQACVASCPRGTFPDASRACQPCHLRCDTCAGPGPHNCTGCERGSALLPAKGWCLNLGQRCPDGTYVAAGPPAVCQRCPSPCELCASAQRCERCGKAANGSATVLTPGGRCEANCPKKHYASDDRHCLPCAPPCSECTTGREDGCLSCLPAAELLLKTNRSAAEGRCVHQCPEGFYLEKKERTCLRCHEACESCRGPSDKDCTVCRKGFVFHEHTCVDPVDLKCGDGQYKQLGQCLACHPSCHRCDGGTSGNCLECRKPTDVLYQGHCQSACPEGLVALNFTDKLSPRGVVRTCVYCHPLCAACSGPTVTMCTLCHPGFTLTKGGVCQQQCSVAGGGRACEKCSDSGCAVCVGADRCLVCKEGSVLVQGRCQLHGACPWGYAALNGRCVTCLDPACGRCNGSELENCIACQANFQLQKSGKCLPPQLCRTNEYLDHSTKTCRPCHPFCRTCSGPGNDQCRSCRHDSCLVVGVCRPCCSSIDRHAAHGPYPCANCSLGADPTCLLGPLDMQPDQSELDQGANGDWPAQMHLFIPLAFSICIVLPALFFLIFCGLQLRSGQQVLCCVGLGGHTNPRPAGPDYTPLSSNANGSPEKTGGVFVDVELTDCPTKNGRTGMKEGDDCSSSSSSGVGSSPDKSPERNETAYDCA